MANKKTTNVSMEVGVDVDLLLSQIADKKLFGPIKKHLDKASRELSKSHKLPLDMQLDTHALEKEFNKATRDLKKMFSKTLKEMGAGLDEGNIAKELSKRLKSAGDAVTKDGKIVKEKLRAILEEISREAGLHGALQGRGKNPLKEYLGLADKSITEATKTLKEKSAIYSSTIKQLVGQQSQILRTETRAYEKDLKRLHSLVAAGKRQTQRELDATSAAFVQTDPRRGSAKEKYDLHRTPGSGASSEDLKRSAQAYKLQIENAITQAKALKEMEGSGVSMGVEVGELDDRLEELARLIPVLNKEINQLTGNFKHAEEGASLTQKQVRKLKDTLEKLHAEAKQSALVAGKTGKLEDLEKQAGSIRRLTDAYKALGELTGQQSYKQKAASGEVALADIQKRINLETKLAEIRAKARSVEEGAKELTSARKFLTEKELLVAIGKQARLTQEALVAMDQQGWDTSRMEKYQRHLEALRKEQNLVKASIDAGIAALRKPALHEPPSSGEEASNAVSSRLKRLRHAESITEQFGPTANSRERVDMYVKQRKALEEYMASLRNLKLLETDESKIADHSRELDLRQRQLRSLNQEISGVDSAIAQMGRSFSLFFRYAIAYQALYQIQALFMGIAKEVGNLQHALVGIKAVTSATSGAMVDVEASIKSVAQSTSFTTDEIAKGGQTLAQAGVEIKEFGKELRATANLASATGSAFEVTAGVISTFLNVFKDLDPDTIADKLRNAVNISKLTMEDLTSIANYMLETTEAFNISIDTTLAAAATLRNAGFKASTIATGGRQAILELLSPDAKTLKALQSRYAKIGMDLSQDTIKGIFTGFRSAADPFIAVLNELEKLGMGGIADDELSRVFDIRAENAIRGLINNRDELLRNKIALQATGTAADGAKTQLESLQNSFQNLGEAITTLVFDQSKGFISWLRDAVKGMTDLVTRFKEAQTSLKARTGETGASDALAAGSAATAVLALVAKLSVGWSLAFGVVTGGLEFFSKYLLQGNDTLQGFSKAVGQASEAILTLLSIVGISKLGGAVGGKVKDVVGGIVGGAAAGKVVGKVASGMASAAPKAAGGLAVAAGEVLAGEAAAVGVVATLGAFFAKFRAAAGVIFKIGKTFLKTNWFTFALLGIYELLDYFNKLPWSKTPAQKLQDTVNSKIDALAQQTQDLKEDQNKKSQLEAEDAATKKTLDGFGQTLATAQQSIKTYASGENANKIAEIMQKAADGTIAVGSQAMVDLAGQIEKLTGKAVDQYTLSGDLQKINEAVQTAEATRKQYADSIVKAYQDYAADASDKEAKALVESFESLSTAQKEMINSTVKTVAQAQEFLDLRKKAPSAVSSFEGASVTEDALADATAKQMQPLIELARAGKDEAAVRAKSQLMSILLEKVQEGQAAVVEALLTVMEGLVPKDLAASLAKTAKNNQIAKLSEGFDKAIKETTDQLKQEKVVLPSIMDFEANKQRAEEEKAAKEKEHPSQSLEEQSLDLEEKIRKTKGEYLQLNIVARELAARGLDDEKALKEASDKILAKKQEVVALEDRLATLKKSEVVDAEKLEEVQRSFYAGEQQIAALQEKLKQAHGAKNHSVAEEAEITKQIHEIQKQQLAAKQEALTKFLGGIAEKEGLGSTKGVSSENLIKALSGSAGAGAMAKSKELADAYKSLTEVVNQRAALEEKFKIDLDNIYRTELESKQKQAQSAYEKQTNSVKNIESRLQSTNDKLIAAREKLANDYEKMGEIEAFFKDTLRAASNKKVTKSDLQDKLREAAASGSIELAKQTATEAQGLSGNTLSKRDAERIIEEARNIATDIQSQEIATQEQRVAVLQTQQNALINEMAAATSVQKDLKSALDNLASQIAALTQVTGASSAGEKSIPEPMGNTGEPTQEFAKGGPIRGPGSTTSDSIPIMASKDEFMQPAKAVSLYGQDFMEAVRNLQVDPTLAKAVVTAPKALGGTTAQKQRQMQPVMFNVGGDMINAQAHPDAVKQFQAALRLQAVKSGRRI